MPVTRVPDDQVIGISSATPEKLLVPYKCAPGNIVHPPYEPLPVQNYYVDQTSGPVLVGQGISPNYYVDQSQYIIDGFSGGSPGTSGGVSQANPQKEVQVQIQKEVGQQNCAVVAQQIWHAVWDAMPGVFAQLISPIDNRNAAVLPQILKQMNRADLILNERGVIDVQQAVIRKLDAKKVDANEIGAGGKPVPNVWAAQVGGANAPVINIFVNTLNIYVTLIIVSSSATAFAVSQDGTNYVFQVDCSAASAATGIKITGAAAGGGASITVISSGTNEALKLDAKGSGTITLGGTSTGAINLSQNTNITGVETVTSSNASALTVGRLGATTPAFQVDASTATSITGIKVKSAASGGGVAVSAIGETNVNLTVDAAGSGTITIGGTSTGAITLTRATTMSNALTYGGVTLSNAVTGTGSMVLSASPTFTGTVSGAAASFSGAIAYGTLTGLTFTMVSDVQVTGLTFQKKTIAVTNGSVGSESGWTTWHTGAAC